MLQISISNSIRIRGASTPLRAAIMTALTMDNPEYKNNKIRKLPTWGLEEKLKFYRQDMGDMITPRGFESELYELLQQQGIDPNAVITRDLLEGQPVQFGWNGDIKLRDYQEPLVDALRAQNGTGVAPAGSGKTIMALNYVAHKHRPTLWLTHTMDLMYQTQARADMCLTNVGRIGIIGDDKQDWGDGKLIIATVQTLHARPELIDQLNQFIGTVVIDEAHHFPASMFIEVGSKLKAKNIIGVTATPERKDQLERLMYVGIGPIQHEITRKHLYDVGQLIKPKIDFVYTKFNYDPASIKDGTSIDAGGEKLDYADLMSKLIHDNERLMQVANNILDKAHLGYSLVLTESVRYSFLLKEYVDQLAAARGYHLRQAVVHGGISQSSWRKTTSERNAKLLAAKYSTEYAKRKDGWYYKVQQYTDAEMEAWRVNKTQRKEILAAVGRKEIDILYATQLAREGLDFAHLNILHLATPKRGDQGSRRDGSSVEQETGRIQRPDSTNPGKQAFLFDYVDYNVEVFKDQYMSRRRVYKRLELDVPKKPRTVVDDIDAFLNIPL